MPDMWWSKKKTENVCGIPKSLVLSPSFIIPLICCAPARDHNRVCLLFVYECRSPFFLFFRRGMSDSSVVRCFSYCYSFCSFALALTVARLAAALIFTGSGHYQLIDYFDCYLIPQRVFAVMIHSSRGRRHKLANIYTDYGDNLNTQISIDPQLLKGFNVRKRECVSYLALIYMMLMLRMVSHLRICVRTCSIDELCFPLVFLPPTPMYFRFTLPATFLRTVGSSSREFHPSRESHQCTKGTEQWAYSNVAVVVAEGKIDSPQQ